MGDTEKITYTTEEIAKMEIRDFVNDGLKDVSNNNLYDFEEVFDELEKRYRDESI